MKKNSNIIIRLLEQKSFGKYLAGIFGISILGAIIISLGIAIFNNTEIEVEASSYDHEVYLNVYGDGLVYIGKTNSVNVDYGYRSPDILINVIIDGDDEPTKMKFNENIVIFESAISEHIDYFKEAKEK